MRSWLVPCLALALACGPVSAAPGIEGDWEGKLEVPGAALRIVFHIRAASEGALTGTMDSPDQGARGLPLQSVSFADGVLRLKLQGVAGDPGFEGKADRPLTVIAGSFKQGGMSFPMTLKRAAGAAASVRPQEPKPPFPYASRSVTYRNAAAGVTLAGTLTIPEGPGPFPAVVLISGSGAQNRDEELMGHRPFLVWADYLARRGIAVLRSDDRGVGGSTGSVPNSTTEELAGDALAAVAFLKATPAIDATRIGLMGHSEGGLIAPICAVRSNDVACIVLLAGPGYDGTSIVLQQSEAMALKMGQDPVQVARSQAISRRLFAALNAATSVSEAEKTVRKQLAAVYAGLTDAERKAVGSERAFVDAQVKPIITPWFRFFLRYDPVPTLRRVRQPVLALDGSLDLQVLATPNLRAVGEALKAGGNTHFTTTEVPGVNHLFQTCNSGLPTEYATIEETLAPKVMSMVGDWLAATFKSSR